MKRISILFASLICVFAMALLLGASASGSGISVVVDGKALEFEVQPQNINGRILVPLRAIFEEFGAEIFWHDDTKTVIAIKGGTTVVLKIGNNHPTVNGEIVEIDQPGVIVDSRTLAPLRFVAEAFGGTAEWDGAANTAYITFPEGGGEPGAFLYHSTVEYGEPDVILARGEPMHAYIRFPHTDDFTESAIEDWAHGVYKSTLDEINRLRAGDNSVTGEINIHFDSYLIGGRYAGIVEKGMYMHSHLAHPIDIIKTFNYDLERGVMLGNAAILDMAHYDVLKLLREKILEAIPEAENSLNDINNEWLTNIAIGHEGLIVILERGMFLPGYLGSPSITLPYDELGIALLINPAAGGASNAETGATGSQASGTDTGVAGSTGTSGSQGAGASSGAQSDTTEKPAATAKPETPANTVPRPSGHIDPSKPMVALSFDDGPSKYSNRILDTLEKHNSRATFCVIGNLAGGKADVIRRQYILGCETIGHSYDHRDLTKLSQSDIRSQIMDTYKIIDSILDNPPKLIRTPYGAVNSTVREVAKDLGFSIISWSVDTLDWQSRNAGKVYDAIMRDTKNKSIILCHDLYESTADAMERVIPELISRGYQLVTVSELIEHSGGNFEAGKVYFSGN